MKRKIKYGILTLLLLGGLYFGLRFTFGLFTPYNFWTAEEDINKGEIKIVVIGLPYKPQLRQVVAKNYNFRFDFIGCTVTRDLQRGIEDYNKTMENYLTEKYGNNFWSRFNNQVDSLEKIEISNEVVNLVEKQKVVKSQINLIDSLSKGQRHVSLVPFLEDTTNNIYLVKVGEDNGVNLVTYYNFLVDANSMKIINPDGNLYAQ